MSYFDMDHAAWVQRSITAIKTKPASIAEVRAARDGKGWLAAPDELNAFQRRAIDILGIVGNGIYNAPIPWSSVYWSPRLITCGWRHSLATFDFIALTRLVLLCHEARIRGEISARSHSYLEITLSERVADGDMSMRHPNLEEMLAAWRQVFPAVHSLVYADNHASAVAAE